MMKKIILLLVLLLFSTGQSGLAAQDILTISAPPSIWAQQENGRLSGPIIELVQKIFAPKDILLETKVLPWARAVENMKTGQLDMMTVIFYTPERAEFMEFSAPYVQVPTSVFVPKDHPFPLESLEDLKGLKGAMMRNDSISEEFSAFENNLSIEKVVSYEQILQMLKSRRIDYAVAAQYGFQIHANRLGFSGDIELLPFTLAKRDLHLAISKKSPHVQHLDYMNEQIQRFQGDGTIEAMVKQAIRQASQD